MSKWKKVMIKDIASLDNGINFSKSAYAPGVKIIGVSDFKNRFSPDFSTLQEVKEEIVKRGDYLQFGDILFVRSNGNRDLVGRCMLIDKNIKSTFSGFCIRLRINDLNSYNPYFFTYHFKTSLFRKSIAGSAIGANIQNLSQNRLGDYELKLPEYFIQCRIAEILSRYDSLIENYQKQIKLLEESAQRLYKEWFVDLRFPGHENTKIVDGVPEGWEKKKAQDFFNMSIGKTPPRIEKKWFTDDKDSIPWVSISDMKDITFVSYTSEKLTKEACDKFNVKIIPVGTVILSFKLTVGRVAITSIPMCTNEAIAHFSKEGNNWRAYTFYYLKNYNYDSLGNTSGISKAVNSTIIKNMPFLLPSENILDSFEEHVNSYFARINNISTQIQLLTEARDRLLPKLMSGEIEV